MSNNALITSAKPYRVVYENFVTVGELKGMKEDAQRTYVVFLRKLGYLTPEMLAFALGDEKGIQTRSLVKRFGLPSAKNISTALKLDEKVETELEKFEKRLLGKEFHGVIRVSLKKCLNDTMNEISVRKLQGSDATGMMEEMVRTEILNQKRKFEEETAMAKVKERQYISIEDVIGKPAEEMNQEDVRKAIIGCPIEPKNSWAEVRDDPEYLCALRLYWPHVTNVDICKYLFKNEIDKTTVGDKFIKLKVKQNTGRRTLYGLETAAFVDWAGGDIDAYLRKENEKVSEISKFMDRANAKRCGEKAESVAEAVSEEKPTVAESRTKEFDVGSRIEVDLGEPEPEAFPPEEAPEIMASSPEVTGGGPGPVKLGDFPEPVMFRIDLSLRGGSRAHLLRMLADIVEEFSEDSRGDLVVEYIGI